jgi:glycosyltransferase involved in cell wall biosynthesis
VSTREVVQRLSRENPVPDGTIHVGVDATCWQLPRGFGRHTRGLLSALLQVDPTNRYTFFTDSPEAAGQLPSPATVRVIATSRPTIAGAAAHGRRRVRDLVKVSRALGDPDLDLVLFPTIYSYVPVLSRAKKLVMIHDVTAETYPELTLDSRAARVFWRAKIALGRWQADLLITVSEYSRDGIAERFRIPRERIHVVGEASDPVFRVLDDPRPSEHLRSLGFSGERRSIVYVGGFSPHKNLARLVAVFARLAPQERFADVDLVLVGEYRHETFFTCFREIRQQVRTLDLERRVIFTGFLPDPELVVLLNRATVLSLPSMTEGFGLPAVEAAACGCPVVATTASPLPELLGEGGVFVDPRSSDALEAALVRVLTSDDLRCRMRQAGLAAVGRLSWNAAARRLVALMRTATAS